MRTVSLFFTFASTITGLAQQQQYFAWDGKQLVPLTNTQSVVCDHWAIWTFGDNVQPATGKPHGEIDGKTAEEAQKKWEEAVKFERNWKKFAKIQSDPTGCENHIGPIAVVKPTPHSTSTNQTLVERAFDLNGNEIVIKAYAVAADYQARGVKYKLGGDASGGGAYSDCSNFVNDVLKKSGLNAPYVDTATIGWPHYAVIPADQAKPGDIIVRRWFDPDANQFEGHMGIYTGDVDSHGRPSGVQMGKSGPQTALWGPNGWFTNGWFDPKTSFQFYRFRQ
jgi:hypothetical protein